MLSGGGYITSRAPLALAHTYIHIYINAKQRAWTVVRGSLAKIHSLRVRDGGTRSEVVDLAHVTSITRGLGIALRDTRPVNRPVFEHVPLNLGGPPPPRRYLNFKSANVYFCHGPATVPRPLPPPSPSISFPVLSAGFPDALNFKFRRDHHRVGRRSGNRLSSVSTRLCAVICFRRPPPLPFFLPFPCPPRFGMYTDSAIYAPRCIWRPALLFMAPPYVCIRIDSVIYFAADSTGVRAAARTREGEFRGFVSNPPSLSPRTLRAAKWLRCNFSRPPCESYAPRLRAHARTIYSTDSE